MNISFFMEHPCGRGLIVDNAVIFSITTHQYNQLSISEKAFVTWYINETNQGMLGLQIGQDIQNSHEVSLLMDAPQEYLCAVFMKLILSKS
ncbi:MAG: hypothetical protein WC087_00615 [Candidatus Paceibacterota bacterium]